MEANADGAQDKKQSKLKRFLDECKKALEVLSGTPAVLKLVWQASPTYTSIVVCLGIAMAVMPLFHLWIGKLIVDVVTKQLFHGGVLSAEHLFSSATVAQLVPLLWALLLIEVLQALTAPVDRFFESELGDKLANQINEMILRKSSSFVDIQFFESAQFYDMLQTAQNTGHRPMQMLTNMVGMWRSFIQFIAVTTTFMIMQPVLSILVLLSSIPNLVMQFKHSKESMDMSIWETPEARRMSYYRYILTDKHVASEIRMFGLANLFIERFLNTATKFTNKMTDYRQKHMKRRLWLAGVSCITDVGAYAVLALRTVTGSISIGDFYFYSSALSQIQGQISNLIWSVTSLYEDNLYMDKFFEFINLEPTMHPPDPAYAFKAPKPIKKGIEFRNVSFSYPNSPRKVLDNLSFMLEPGEKIALVGENGAGKTTIVKLLGRLYDPTEGEILIDGINLKEIDLESWRAQIGVIFQDFIYYQLQVKDNIGVGQCNFIEDEIRIKAAAQRGGASGFIEKLPKQYESQLGSWFAGKEDTADISGGEWQKVALSRLFMRAPDSEINGTDEGIKQHLQNGAAQVLILDEPTSSLDVESEHDIFVRFQELTREKTTVLISHRFSTVRMANQILLLNNGVIQEHGNHDQLMELNGEYARLYKLQADRYN